MSSDADFYAPRLMKVASRVQVLRRKLRAWQIATWSLLLLWVVREVCCSL